MFWRMYTKHVIKVCTQSYVSGCTRSVWLQLWQLCQLHVASASTNTNINIYVYILAVVVDKHAQFITALSWKTALGNHLLKLAMAKSWHTLNCPSACYYGLQSMTRTGWPWGTSTCYTLETKKPHGCSTGTIGCLLISLSRTWKA